MSFSNMFTPLALSFSPFPLQSVHHPVPVMLYENISLTTADSSAYEHMNKHSHIHTHTCTPANNIITPIVPQGYGSACCF